MVFSGHSITANVTALEVLWQRLLDVGERIEESQVMAKILATLPGPYHYFYTVWNNGPADGRTIRLLLSKLQEEEAVQSLREPAPSQNDAAFSSSGGRSQRHYRLAPYHTPRGDYQAGTGGYRGDRAFHEARGAPQGGRGARGAPRGYRGGYRGFRGNSFHSNFDPSLCNFCQKEPHKEENRRTKLQMFDQMHQQTLGHDYHVINTNAAFDSTGNPR